MSASSSGRASRLAILASAHALGYMALPGPPDAAAIEAARTRLLTPEDLDAMAKAEAKRQRRRTKALGGTK